MRVKLNDNEVIEALDVRRDITHKELVMYCLTENIHICFDTEEELNNVFDTLSNIGIIDLSSKKL